MMFMTLIMLLLYILKEKPFMFFTSSLSLDSFNFFLCIIIPISMIIFLSMDFPYLKKEKSIFYSIFLLCSFLSFVCIFTNDFLIFLSFYEFLMVPMVLMMVKFSKDKDKIISITFLMFMNMFGSMPFMILTLKFFKFFSNMQANNFMIYNHFYLSSPLILTMMIILMISKIPIFFFHFWLNKAHVSSSGACSMYLACVMIKLGGAGTIKFIPTMISFLKSVNVSISVAGLMFFSAMMTRFMDKKYVIASSSVIHMSLIFISLLNGKMLSEWGSILMMISHGIMSYILFYLITLEYELVSNRSIILSKSSESSDKTLSLLIGMFIFINLGLPPLISFISEIVLMFNLMLMENLIFYFSLVSSFIMMIFSIYYVCFSLMEKKKSVMENLNSFIPIYMSTIFLLILLFMVL